MTSNENRPVTEFPERAAERAVALCGRFIEAIVGRQPSSRLPHAFHRIELRRVGRKPVQLDVVPILAKPLFPVLGEVVGRTVVDDQEELRAGVLGDQLLQVDQERLAVEDVGKPVGEVRDLLERHGPVDVSRFAKPEGVDPGLNADARPGLVERPVEPEARLVLERYEASARRGFFLIAGSWTLSQMACRSASARASRLRGRWTENPILFRRRGT